MSGGRCFEAAYVLLREVHLWECARRLLRATHWLQGGAHMLCNLAGARRAATRLFTVALALCTPNEEK